MPSASVKVWNYVVALASFLAVNRKLPLDRT